MTIGAKISLFLHLPCGLQCQVNSHSVEAGLRLDAAVMMIVKLFEKKSKHVMSRMSIQLSLNLRAKEACCIVSGGLRNPM